MAAIVKIDDLGLYLLKKSNISSYKRAYNLIGRFLLIAAPFLMKTLTIIGTLAMFLVGGGILVHNLPWLHHVTEQVAQGLTNTPVILTDIASFLIDGIVGFCAGILVFLMVFSIKKIPLFKVAVEK